MTALRSLVESLQEKVFIRYGTQVDLVLLETNDCRYLQATAGHNREGLLRITVSPGLLDRFSLEELMYVGCHEMGHILGEVTPVEAGVKTTFDSRDSLEGEADYFAGSCTRDHLKKLNPHQVPERVTAAVVAALQFFHGKDVRLDPEGKRKKKYRKGRGIDHEYPSPSCRMLSVLEGMANRARPTCWYNPKER